MPIGEALSTAGGAIFNERGVEVEGETRRDSTRDRLSYAAMQ